MYLRGSKWSYTKRRKPFNPFRILFLAILVAGAIYVNEVVVPVTHPLFIPTPTPTRSPESFVTEAENYLANGKMSQAMESYQSAIQADPKNPSNFINLARLQVYSGKYEDAVTNASNALLLSPNNSMAAAIRGWALAYTADDKGNKNYLDGEAALGQAIKLDPNNAVAYAYLAEVLANKHQDGKGDLTTLDKAIEYSKKALALGPNLLETHRARGLILEITQNNEEAVKEFEAAAAINNNIADVHISLGRNYRLLQLYDKAVEEFNRANALNPNDPIPLAYISTTYLSVGEFTKAIQYAQQAIKASPTDPYLYGNLGSMQYRTKNYPDAIASLRLAIRGGTSADGATVEGLPLDYGRIAEYYYMFGLALARTGQCGEAIQISVLLQQGVPDDETSVYNAQEMNNICQTAADQPQSTPTVGGTPEKQTTGTPQKTTATAKPKTVQPTATP
jgi:tetratricopeptide (TPR) repeat protein